MTTSSKDAGHPPRPHAALILAGAAAKGPYAAGALAKLAQARHIEVKAIAGASSGALNAAVYAAGLRVGQAEQAAAELATLWKEGANLHAIASYSRRKQLLLDALRKFAPLAPVERARALRLRVVVASLPGELDAFGRLRFEHSEQFVSSSFEDPDTLEYLAELCLASAALPVIFAPRTVGTKAGKNGPFWDGGIVDDAPIGWALGQHEPEHERDAIEHIIVVSPETNLISPGPYGCLSLNRLFEMLVDERLNRDLNQAQSFNRELGLLQKALESLTTPSEGERLAREIGRRLNWRKLKFMEIRPRKELRGNVLAGFFCKQLRADYVKAGEEAAQRALEQGFVELA